MEDLYNFVSNTVYPMQAIVALWAAYCAILVWRRIANLNFRTNERQAEFLDTIEPLLQEGNFEQVTALCEESRRALPQLAQLGVENRHLDPSRLQQFLVEHFQRDVLADMEYRMSWVAFGIKTEPMLGLLGTVLGMMAAFAKLATAAKVDQTSLAEDISFALITTAVGLTVAIPLMLASAAINVRTKKMEDRIGLGLSRLFDMFRHAPMQELQEIQRG